MSRSPRRSPIAAALASLALAATVHAAPPACTGDCDRSNDVTVDEIVTMVFIALGGTPISTCIAGDADTNGSITVDEIITASTKALDGCNATPTPSTSPTPDDTATLTHTPEVTPTGSVTEEPEETETPERTATETPLESETPAATFTNGMMPLTPSPPATTVAPSPSVPATATKTSAPAATDTPEPPPTHTAAVAPTHTLAPLPTHTAGGGTRLDVGSAAGAPGSTVSISVVLSGGNGIVTATSNDIVYDTSRVRAVQTGGPVCTINPAIGQGSSLMKMLLTSVAGAGGSAERLRIGVISFSNSLSIPDGLLFTCQFAIDASAPAGGVVLQNLPSASSALGDPVPAAGSNGLITVQ
jgi:hypothetical protein